MSSTGDLLHVVTPDQITPRRVLLGKLLIWATGLCTAQVVLHGEKGKRVLFILPGVLFVVGDGGVSAVLRHPDRP